MKNLSLNQLGFTLVELLVAIVIIVILSTIGIASFNSANTRNELQNQAKEIQSKLRALRTDSVAAVKPVTSSVAASSCKAPDDNNPATTEVDGGTYYGAYMVLDKTTSTHFYETGVACWNSDGAIAIDLSGTPTRTNLVPGVIFTLLGIGTPIPTRRVIFYSFNGNVYTWTLAIGAYPTYTFVSTLPSGQLTDNRTIGLQQGSDLFAVRLNGSGLVCAQTSTTINCAQ